MNNNNSTIREKILLFTFLLSGVSGLVYEITWMRMLVLIFGNTVSATSIILSSYMAGLALGSFLFGRFIDRKRNILKVFSAIEAGIGISALLLPFAFSAVRNLSIHFPGGAVRIVLCFAVLLIPTTLLGGTLPVISKFMVKQVRYSGRKIGTLYGLNTLGGAAGCFLTGFILIGSIGIRWTVIIAALINLSSALIIYLLRGSKPAEPSVSRQPAGESGKGRLLAVYALALSGFCALAYEVLWTRTFSFFFINSTYSFATIITIYLCGLALGSWLMGRITDGSGKRLALLGTLQILVGLYGFASILIITRLEFIPKTIYMVFGESWWSQVGTRFISYGMVVFVPAVLMGGMFPLVSRISLRKKDALGSIIGSVYSANTAGAIFGAVTAGFILIPVLGVQKSIMLISSIIFIMGTVLVINDPAVGRNSRWKLALPLIITLPVINLILPADLINSVCGPAISGQQILFRKEGIDSTVTVYEWDEPLSYRMLTVNGIGEVPTDYTSMRAFRLLGYLPLLHNPDARKALVLSFGGGITTGSIAQLEQIKEVDCVEICGVVPEAAKYFSGENHNVLDNPKVNLIINDGRNYLLKNTGKYDIITADATHPANGDSWVLYTREFYRQCRKKLEAGGVLCQWVPMHGLSRDRYNSILKTFVSVFPHATLWYAGSMWSSHISPYFGHSILVGTREPVSISLSTIREKLQNRMIKSDLEKLNLADIFSLLGCFVTHGEGIMEMVSGAGINTDDLPFVAFHDPKDRNIKECVTELLADILEHREVVTPIIRSGNLPLTDRLKDKLNANHKAGGHSLRGEVHQMEGMFTFLRDIRSKRDITPADKYKKLLEIKKKLEAAIAEYKTSLSIVRDGHTERLLKDARENLIQACSSLAVVCKKLGMENRGRKFYEELKRLEQE